MISFPVGAARFNFRTAAVIIHDEYVLLHRADSENFWALPGGRVEILESSDAALARELREELGTAVDAHVGRLLWIDENFYEHQGVPHHELGAYYLVTLGNQSLYLAKDQDYVGVEHDLNIQGSPVRLIFRWFPLATIDTVRLYPTFLGAGLNDLPESPEHLIHHHQDQ